MVQAFLEEKGVESVGALFLGNGLLHQPKPERVHVRMLNLSKTAPGADFSTMPLECAALPIQRGPDRLIDSELPRDTAKPIPGHLSPVFRKLPLAWKNFNRTENPSCPAGVRLARSSTSSG